MGLGKGKNAIVSNGGILLSLCMQGSLVWYKLQKVLYLLEVRNQHNTNWPLESIWNHINHLYFFKENYEVTLTRPDYDLGQWRIKIEVNCIFRKHVYKKLFWVGRLLEFTLWFWLHSNFGAGGTETKLETVQ